MFCTLALPCFLLFLTGGQPQKEVHRSTLVTVGEAIGVGCGFVVLPSGLCFANPAAFYHFPQMQVERSKVTTASFHRIKLGMTMEQVENILGSPDDVEGNEDGYSCSWTVQRVLLMSSLIQALLRCFGELF